MRQCPPLSLLVLGYDLQEMMVRVSLSIISVRSEGIVESYTVAAGPSHSITAARYRAGHRRGTDRYWSVDFA